MSRPRPASGWLLCRTGCAALLVLALVAGCVSQKDSNVGSTTFDFKPTGAAVKPTKKPGRAAPVGAPAPSAADLRASQTVTNRNRVITLIDPSVGRVASVNPSLRFVVLDFSLHRLPAIGQRLSVYRQGQKVGELEVTGPELNQDIVADLVAGEAQSGDEVRDN